MKNSEYILEIREYQKVKYVFLDLGVNISETFTRKAMEKALESMKSNGIHRGLMVRAIKLDQALAMRTMKNAQMVLNIMGVSARIAIIYQTYDEMERFIETVLVNRGISARVFTDLTPALEWLIADNQEHPPTQN